MNELLTDEKHIQSNIFTIRGKQVILDSDLAILYKVETRVLNQAVKRNIKRFPLDYMFQLSVDEYNFLISQFVISKNESLKSQSVISKENRGGRRKLPLVFTEQGVSMLSAVLKSDTAIEISIKIINAFVEMRKFLLANGTIFQKFNHIEQKLIKHDENFGKIFKAIGANEIKPEQGIFFDGQIFDAYVFISTLIKSAKKSVTLIDNYIDETVLTLFSKNQKVKVTIYSKNIT